MTYLVTHGAHAHHETIETNGQLRHFLSADMFDYFSRILELSHTTARH